MAKLTLATEEIGGRYRSYKELDLDDECLVNKTFALPSQESNLPFKTFMKTANVRHRRIKSTLNSTLRSFDEKSRSVSSISGLLCTG